MKLEDVKKIVVLGSGIMGSGIAEVCARAGYQVALVDISDELLKKGLDRIKASMGKAVEKGKLSKEDAEAAYARIKPTTSLEEACKDADVVIEAIPEDMELKKKVFKQLDEICPERTIFASNTSSLMITDMASATKRPDRFIGMHWFNPAPIMKLIEIIRGALTSDETYNLIKALSEKLGKITATAMDAPGFFTSRIISLWLLEALKCLEEGIATVKDIDLMCKLAFGHPMGPFELLDLIGLDTALHIIEYLHKELGDPRYTPPLILKKMVMAGYLGDPRLKPGSKGGIYDYFKIPKQ
ncbi:3-hydroxyacyl-CoA dehydrogenase [Candidatus Bathyarchaeota archaeon]|nr:MAG: 3-hydroxyacyl-CoA dehydrogenase [Candidatus Bathyarchaeota archaeon]